MIVASIAVFARSPLQGLFFCTFEPLGFDSQCRVAHTLVEGFLLRKFVLHLVKVLLDLADEGVSVLDHLHPFRLVLLHKFKLTVRMGFWGFGEQYVTE